MDSNHWEHFAHEADIGVRGIGNTKQEAFAQAALALTAVITDPESVKATDSVTINCEEADDELLFVDWLNALIYEMATRKMLFSKFDVEVSGARLTATVRGEPADVTRHKPAVEIKGATYTALSVKKNNQGLWTVQCVVDV